MSLSNTTSNTIFESNSSKDKQTPVINPKFDDNNLSLDGFNSHLKELDSLANDFPVHVLPESVRDIVSKTNECLNFPIAFIAAAILHAVSTAVGNKYLSKWKWLESACMYMLLVGNPGTIKTHPLSFAYAPFHEKDRDFYRDFKEEMKNFDIANSLYQKNKKEGGDPPPKPALRKYIVQDCTIEALVHVHLNNPQGICSLNDEGLAWINNMNRYSSNSSELQQWLSNWSRQPIIVDRKSSPPVRIETPFVNVAGTIQPGVLEEMRKDNKTKNGFIDRILFVMPKGLKRQRWNTNELDMRVRGEWFRIVNKILSLEFARDADGNELSNHLTYTKDAEAVLRKWQEDNIKEDEEFESETRDGVSAKIEVYVFRFSLLLQIMKWACGEADKTCIDAASVTGAVEIAKYFKHTALDVADLINSRSPIDHLPENKQIIYRQLSTMFTTAQGVQLAIENAMPERTFKHWLNDKTLFKHIKQGEYQKII
jgi:hypothetical protein